MFYPNINRKLETAFINGQLPTMVYINKQNRERKTVQRPLHKHDSICELLLVYEGSGTYYADDATYPLSEGSIVYYNQGGLHEVVSETQNEIGSYCIGITNLRKHGLPPNYLIAPGEPPVRCAGVYFSMIRQLCESMFELEGSSMESELTTQLLCSALVVFTGQLELFSLTDSDMRKEEQMVLRIRKYLNEHFMEDMTLEMIADALGCSETYISHVFKKATGKPPIQYVIRRRIGHAQTLLISTNYSAAQIATMVGYGNTNYFSTLFSKIVGMSPSRYREFYKEEMKGMQNQS